MDRLTLPVVLEKEAMPGTIEALCSKHMNLQFDCSPRPGCI